MSPPSLNSHHSAADQHVHRAREPRAGGRHLGGRRPGPPDTARKSEVDGEFCGTAPPPFGPAENILKWLENPSPDRIDIVAKITSKSLILSPLLKKQKKGTRLSETVPQV